MNKLNGSLSRVKIIYITTTLFLVVLSIYAFVETKNLIDSSNWINKSNRITLSLQRLSSFITDAEADQRGFLLTGESVLLAKRNLAFKNLDSELHIVTKLTQDNPQQIKNLQILRKAIDGKLLSMRTVLESYQSSTKWNNYKTKIVDGVDKMEKVKHQLKIMQDDESKLLVLRSQKYLHLTSITPYFIIFLFLGALFILLVSYFRINNALNLTQNLERNVLEKSFEVDELHISRKLLEESEQRYENLIYTSPSAIGILYGEDFIISIANEPIIAIWGKGKEIIGKPYFEALPELAEQGYKEVFAELCKTGIPFSAVETPIYIIQNGVKHLRYFNFLLYAQRNIDREIEGIGIIATEVTSQALINNKIKQSEQRFQAAIQAVEGILWTNTANGEMEGEQKGWASLTGQTYDEYKGYGWAAAVHPDDAQPTVDAWKQAVSSRTPFVFEHRVKTKDGTYKNFSIRAIPLLDAEGDLCEWVGVHTDITHLKETEKVLRENEQKLNDFIDASELGTFELNLENDSIVCSDRLYHIFGFDQGKVLTHAEFIELLHPDDVALRDQSFNEALTSGTLHFHTRAFDKNKNIKWLEVRGRMYYNSEHIPLTLVGTCRDITEERIKQQVLEESEQKFRLLADSMPQHVWTSDAEGNLNYYNQSVFDYAGMTLEEFNAKGWLEIVHPEDREGNITAWINSVTTGKEFLFEHRFLKHTGEYRWQLSRAIPQKDDNGQIKMWVGTSTDIQDQKTFAERLEHEVSQRTAELQQSEEKFNALFDLAPYSASLSETLSGKIIMVNEYFVKTFGYSREDIIGKTADEVRLTDHDAREKLVADIIMYGSIDNKEIEFNSKSGEKIPALTSSVLIEIGGEKFYLSAHNDIRERKEAEHEIEQKNNDLEKMNRELESFAYISSHDLQEPLRKIQLFASRILDTDYDSLTDNVKGNFMRMQEAAFRMQTLIQDLLTYSRTKTAERQFETINLNIIIDEVREDLHEDIKDKHAIIEATALCEVSVIPFQFRQLMHNLIGNALKFSNNGQAPHIKISSEIVDGATIDNEHIATQKKYCHISVADNGIGFDNQYAEKIFEVFQRLHSKSDFNGTGIGLSIVKRIVENHEGIIKAHSEQHQGATFDIYIPDHHE